MNQRDRAKIIKAFNNLGSAKPVKHKLFPNEYMIEISEKDYLLLKPIIWSFKTTSYKVGEFEFSLNGRIFNATEVKDEQGRILLSFKDKNEFIQELNSLVTFIQGLFIVTQGTSFKYLYEQFSKEESHGKNTVRHSH